MKIALGQINVIPNKPKKNLETMLKMISEAKSKNIDIIVFPELSVSGYLLGDEWFKDDVCLNFMHFNESLRKASKGITLIYGNIFLDHDINTRLKDKNYHPNKDGRTRKYNAVYIYCDGKTARRLKETNILPFGIQPKTLLPNYRFFDDQRYFFSTVDIAQDFNVELSDLLQPFVVDIKGKKLKIGVEVCEDLWCEDYRRNGNSLNPTKILINNGADLIFNISASPWTYGKNNARDRRIQFLKKESKEKFVPFLYVNCVGVQNNGKNFITFDGGSTVYNKEGLPVLFSKAPYLEELMLVNETDFDSSPKIRKEKSEITQKYDALIRGIQHIKDVLDINEYPKFVVGLSGGVDSSVVAALLVKAVGKDKVLGLNMPTKYNSLKTRNCASQVAAALDIPYFIAPIENLVKENEEHLTNIQVFGKPGRLSDLNKENIQAKIRATSILSNFAAMYNALFTNNANKDEIALGYGTLYGDWGGALSIPGDLTKADIFKLAKYLNAEVFHKEVIPKVLLPDELFRYTEDQIQPSAELKDNQVDPIRFGYHCALINAATDYKKKTPEEIMRWYLEGTLEKNLSISYDLIKRWDINIPEIFVKDLEWFYSQINKSIFKRVQGPPIIALTKSSYGYDIRESILPYENSVEFEKLKKKVLKLKEYKSKEEKNEIHS